MKNGQDNRNSQRTCRTAAILIVCAALVLFGMTVMYFVYNKKINWEQADLTVTQETLHNPYCGW